MKQDIFIQYVLHTKSEQLLTMTSLFFNTRNTCMQQPLAIA